MINIDGPHFENRTFPFRRRDSVNLMGLESGYWLFGSVPRTKGDFLSSIEYILDNFKGFLFSYF